MAGGHHSPDAGEDGALVLSAGLHDLADTLGHTGARFVAGFLPLPGEVDLRGLFASLRSRGVTVVVPRVNGSALEFARYDPLRIRKGRFGINEPTDDDTCALEQCAAVVVPALACDRSGRRLGRGGGYYDRALANAPAGIWKVGCVIDANLWPAGEVPVEPHDVSLDAVVTPSRLLVLNAPRPTQ